MGLFSKVDKLFWLFVCWLVNMSLNCEVNGFKLVSLLYQLLMGHFTSHVDTHYRDASTPNQWTSVSDDLSILRPSCHETNAEMVLSYPPGDPTHAVILFTVHKNHATFRTTLTAQLFCIWWRVKKFQMYCWPLIWYAWCDEMIGVGRHSVWCIRQACGAVCCFLLSLAMRLWKWGVCVVSGDPKLCGRLLVAVGLPAYRKCPPPITHTLTAYKCRHSLLMAHNEIHLQGCLFTRPWNTSVY